MKIRDLMTAEVMTIGPGASLKEAARRMVEASVSGLPVTDGSGSVVGMITEADFVKTEADRRADKRALLLRLFTRDTELPKSERHVGDVMTSEVITIGPDADHAEAARLMKKVGIKRIPVVGDSGELLGLVSRSDVLRAFIRPDKDILDEIVNRVMTYVLWIDPKRVDLTCVDGNVVLSGRLETRSDAELLAEFTRRVDGVASLESKLTYEIDNTKVSMAPPAPAGFIPRGW